MTRLSDEEILNKVMTAEPVLVMSKFLNYSDLQDAKTIKSYRLAESIYIPQIEKLQGEIETVKKNDEYRTRLCVENRQRLEMEIEHLNVQHEELVNGQEYLREQLAQLTAKHERLVNGLKVKIDQWKEEGWDEYGVIIPELNKFITEEGNV